MIIVTIFFGGCEESWYGMQIYESQIAVYLGCCPKTGKPVDVVKVKNGGFPAQKK